MSPGNTPDVGSRVSRSLLKAAAAARPGLLAAALLAVWVAMLWVGLGRIDRDILETLYVGDRPYLEFIAQQAGHLGAPEAIMVLTIGVSILLITRQQYWHAALPPFATLFAHEIAVLQRDAIGRPRPGGFEGLEHLQAPSFPPTRVVDPMTAYLLVGLLLTNGGRDSRLAVIAAVLIGASNGIVRIVLGHHWPSDVIAGWALGAAVALAAYQIARYLPDQKRFPRPLIER